MNSSTMEFVSLIIKRWVYLHVQNTTQGCTVWHICSTCYETICLCAEWIHVGSTGVTACVWEEKLFFFLNAPHTILHGSCSFSYGFPYAWSPYIWLKVPQFLANSPLNLSESRESATGDSSTFHLEERLPLPKRKAQNILFLELNSYLFYFSKVWLSVMCVAVLSSDSAPPSWSCRTCGLFTLHTNSFTRGSSTLPSLRFCFKRWVFFAME